MSTWTQRCFFFGNVDFFLQPEKHFYPILSTCLQRFATCLQRVCNIFAIFCNVFPHCCKHVLSHDCNVLATCCSAHSILQVPKNVGWNSNHVISERNSLRIEFDFTLYVEIMVDIWLKSLSSMCLKMWYG